MDSGKYVWFCFLQGEGGDGMKRVDLLACLTPINNNSSKVRKGFVFHGDTAGSLSSVQINICLGREFMNYTVLFKVGWWGKIIAS